MILIITIDHNIYLNFGNSDITRTTIKQNSENTHILHIYLYENSQAVNIENSWIITLLAKKPDGKKVLLSSGITKHVGSNLIDVTVSTQMLTTYGTEKCELLLRDGSNALFSDTFYLYIEENVITGEEIESTDDINSIVTVLQHVTEYEESANEIVSEMQNKKEDIDDTYADLQTAINTTQTLIEENESIASAETSRVSAEELRETNTTNAIENAEKVNIETVIDTDSYKYKITDHSGNSQTTPNLLNKLSIGTVESGEYDEEASANITGNFGSQVLNLRIPIGQPFKIVKTYSSISNMNADFSGTSVLIYQFVMINTGNVEDEDTAKLYMKGESNWIYITDLSGAQGIQGVKGEQGIQGNSGKNIEFNWNGTQLGIRLEGDKTYSYVDLKGIQGDKGDKGNIGNTPNLTIGTVTTGNEGTSATATITGTSDNPILNLTIPKGATGSVESISALSLPYNGTDDTQTTKEVVDSLQTNKANVNHTHTKSDILDFPTSIPATEKGSANGVAELDSNGLVPTSQLPSYVDDVLEYNSLSLFPISGEAGKIYVATDTNKTYRWSGSSYVVISETIAIGETSSTAYRGDRGKTAYEHSNVTGNPHGTTANDLGISVPIEIIGTLTAGSTSVTLSNANITTTSTLDIYTDVYGVNPTDVTVASGSVTLTFKAQENDISVKVVV